MSVSNLYTHSVVDSAGQKIGPVGQVYLDNTSGLPSWITAKTGLFGTKQLFIPLEYAQIIDEEILVPYERAFVLGSPLIDADRQLSVRDEAELCEYYGIVASAPAD